MGLGFRFEGLSLGPKGFESRKAWVQGLGLP